ncbi:MAG: UvrD-helicase domain-containing protein [Nitrospirae bacterium]|nr:UvrD-helicase domain-containing protein [Nitrospirota bacterium]
MKILEYNDLDTSKVSRQYQKVIGYLQADDFHSAEVKKLAEHNLYRAKLDDGNRLILKLMTYGGECYALALEVVHNHAYDRSKFLRGARIDESKILPFEKAQLEKETLPSLVYINPANTRFHLLDKIISFDTEQEEIYRLAAPLIVIGPAGSGKTALILEKMKRSYGQVLYVTLSPYLADNSRNLYYSHHYENEDQEISFFSFREFLETMRVPEGREIKYNVFAKWLLRFPRQQRVADAHRLYEEFRGVITGSILDKPWLSREDYLGLGVRQSIYLNEERELVYTLFEKYLSFLRENNYYDPNVLAHGYLKHVQPAYDLVVVDEVQDITNIQLQLILRSLKEPDNFILCGDSNQIVHPNFFSWSSLKSMLYNAGSLELKKVMRILYSNFRNSEMVTYLANKLLRVKRKRFGSVDRESNYLMRSLSEKTGEVVFMKDTDKVKRELNQKTRRSAKFAVLVMREEEKAAVRQYFDTPLLFSIQEAKGLEYENVILVNFISGERATFQEIINGVSHEDLEGDFEYMRERDKTDKSLEVYKFFVNSLYVAVTRAVQRLYLIENDIGHPLIRMLGIHNAQDKVTVEAKQSTIEEWQAEARQLELQGRQEQADEIRRDILKTQSVPWEVCSSGKVMELLARARDEKEISQKPKKALFEYGLFYDERRLIRSLSMHGFDRAKQIYFHRDGKLLFNRSLYDQQRANLAIKYLQGYTGKFYKDILRQCELYGVDHRTVFNKTPLMLAAGAGNAAPVQELTAAGADAELTDNYGLTAWQGALQRAAYDKKFASELFPDVHEILAPSSVSLKVDDRLIKIDGSQGEFLLFHIFFAVLRLRIDHDVFDDVPLTAPLLAEIMTPLPDSVIHDYRKKRAYISALLSKNEVGSANPYNRKLFIRKKTGRYILNPKLAIRQKEEWIDIYRHANIELISAAGLESGKDFLSSIESLISDKDANERTVARRRRVSEPERKDNDIKTRPAPVRPEIKEEKLSLFPEDKHRGD